MASPPPSRSGPASGIRTPSCPLRRRRRRTPPSRRRPRPPQSSSASTAAVTAFGSSSSMRTLGSGTSSAASAYSSAPSGSASVSTTSSRRGWAATNSSSTSRGWSLKRSAIDRTIRRFSTSILITFSRQLLSLAEVVLRLVELGDRQVADGDEALQVVAHLHDDAVVEHPDDLALERAADGVVLGQGRPGVVLQLLDAQADAALAGVDVQDLHLHACRPLRRSPWDGGRAWSSSCPRCAPGRRCPPRPRRRRRNR